MQGLRVGESPRCVSGIENPVCLEKRGEQIVGNNVSMGNNRHLEYPV